MAKAFVTQGVEALVERGLERSLCERLAQHIETAAPAELVKMSPFVLADRWQADREDVLELFLHATRVGLCDLEWDLRCPGCQGSTQLVHELMSLGREAHCAYCKLDFTGTFDASVEVTFRVNDNARRIAMPSGLAIVQTRCKLEPGLPVSVPAKSEQRLELVLGEGTWHLRSGDWTLGSPMMTTTEAVDDHDEASGPRARSYRIVGEPPRIDSGPPVVAPGPYQLHIVNELDRSLDLEFARQRDQPWVSGALVANRQSFRDMFSSELIGPDADFAVQSLSFLFTDILGSTALYERLGDSAAYALVREHFAIIEQIVAEHHGAVVKTIGDAVMASFMVAHEAAAAVFAIHAALDAFNRAEQTRDDIIVKMGLHRGPCIAVTCNERLDYFGRSVNLAARIQGLSTGGDVVLSASHAGEPETAALVRESGWRQTQFDVALKGLTDQVAVVRLQPASA